MSELQTPPRPIGESTSTGDSIPTDQPVWSRNSLWILAVAAPVALWLSQPPVSFWPLAMIAIVPWIQLATSPRRLTRRDYLILWSFSAFYWLISLQGLRLAHPLMFIPWLAFGGYLAVYHVLFVAAIVRCNRKGIPMIVAVPIVWVGLECVRNYMLTGISVLMLGHHVVDVPELIQIADIFGTYGVSFLLAMINVSLWILVRSTLKKHSIRPAMQIVAVTAACLITTIIYGRYRIDQPTEANLATFALIQRSEPIEFDMAQQRSMDIFLNYAKQTVQSAKAEEKPIDAVVWPESMFTAAAPWRIADDDADFSTVYEGTKSEFEELIRMRQLEFSDRAKYVQSAVAAQQPTMRRPQLLVGCGVYHYADEPVTHSGLIQVGADGTTIDWYGKTHLVIIGEYVPIVHRIAALQALIPDGLRVEPGPGAKRMLVGNTVVAPNICIETAVERVTINHLASHEDISIPDVVITVTNDAWYDDSSVIDHHLVCARMVAVGCRRPILSAANSGPTAWIDSCGQLVERLATGTNGAIIATPKKDSRVSPYLRIGDWPARLCVIAMIGMLIGFRNELD